MLLLVISLLFSRFAHSQVEYMYYYDGKLDKNGVLTVDAKGETNSTNIPGKTIKIDDFSYISSYYSVEDQYFNKDMFIVSDIENLNTSQPLNTSEISCNNVALSHEMGIYGLLGFTYKSIYLSNVYSPSITYMLKNGPSKITYKNVADGLQGFQDREIDQSCDSAEAINYLTFSLYNKGFASTECFPNDVIPESVDQCTNGRQVSKMLKNYKIGQFKEQDSLDIKDLLLRFGAVLVDDMIIVGWNDNKWIVAVRDPIEYKYTGQEIQIDDDRIYNGFALFEDYTSSLSGLIAVYVLAPIAAVGSVIGRIFCCKKRNRYSSNKCFQYFCCFKCCCSYDCCCPCGCRCSQQCCYTFLLCTYCCRGCTYCCRGCSCRGSGSGCCSGGRVVEEYNDLTETEGNKSDQDPEVSSVKPEGPPIYSLPSQQTSYSATPDPNVEQQQPVIYPSSYTATPGKSYRQHPIKYPSSYTATPGNDSLQTVAQPSSYTTSVKPSAPVEVAVPVEDTARTSYSVEDEPTKDISEDS